MCSLHSHCLGLTDVVAHVSSTGVQTMNKSCDIIKHVDAGFVTDARAAFLFLFVTVLY